MNCSVTIGGTTHLGFFEGQRGTVIDVRMATNNGYNFVINNMNAPAVIDLSDGRRFNVNRIVAFVPNTMDISFQ